MIKLFGDRVLIKPEEAQKKTVSGIVLPEASQGKSQIGKVFAVGTGRYTTTGEIIAPVAKVGDRVLFEKFAGEPIKVDDEDLLLMNEYNIIGVITNEH